MLRGGGSLKKPTQESTPGRQVGQAISGITAFQGHYNSSRPLVCDPFVPGVQKEQYRNLE